MYPPPAPVNGGEARWLWHRELGDVLMFILVAATEGGVGERRTGYFETRRTLNFEDP
jgi:hypothetical protein